MGGLSAPVTVTRDAWGIPHISAVNEDDLFFAQGFVQAQDRLFQMDLWKRAVQGRLAEVLGANFIDRDAMTRRVQFRGDIEREWASYGPDTRRIAIAFTNGINAWVRRARVELPEEFVLAGWAPELWRPEDLLNRTDAFLASANAADDLLRARLAAAIGVSRAMQIFPPPTGESVRLDPDVDLSAITYVVPDTLRRIGTAPFFLTLAAPASTAPRPSQQASEARTTTGSGASGTAASTSAFDEGGASAAVTRGSDGSPIVSMRQVDALIAPGRRYLVHLSAPGFNVAGATSPWLPGVAVGHNDRIAWTFAPVRLDTQDVFVERLNPADPQQVERDGRWVDMAIDHERLDVKGRSVPFEYDRQYTPNGVVIARDRERRLVYTLRWSGVEPGGAGELAAIVINRAQSWSEFHAALSRWKMPIAEFVYADVDGRVERRRAGLVPSRPPGIGALVNAGWRSANAWNGWVDLAAEPVAAMPDRQAPSALLASRDDADSSAAAVLLPLLARLQTMPAALEKARATLAAWDGMLTSASAGAHLYVELERATRRLAAERLVPPELVDDVANRIDLAGVLAPPRAPWFAGASDRDALVVRALAAAVEQQAAAGGDERAEAIFSVTFRHPLAVFDAARRRFDVGPFPRGGSANESVFVAGLRPPPTFRATFHIGNWDRSTVMAPPGQSGSPSSVHYDDLAAAWARGDEVPLPFSADAVQAAARDMLMLK